MKKYFVLPACFLMLAFSLVPANSYAIFGIGTILAKIIKAMDIAVQKSQNATLQLQNAQRVLEDAMSKLKLNEITDWANKEKSLFTDYYDALAKVKTVISAYQKVKEIISIQADLVSEYKEAYRLFKNDPHFNPDEISYMYNVYTGMINRSIDNLDELMMVANSFETKMTDGKRLELIADVTHKMETVRTQLLQFNRQNMQVSVNRSASEEEANAVKRYYGL